MDAACSRFRADSEIRSLTGGQHQVSPLLAEAIAVALRAARLTDGDVDPTVGAAMSAAGYDRDFQLIEPNGPPLSLTVRQVPGWREVRLDGRSLILPARSPARPGRDREGVGRGPVRRPDRIQARLRRAGQPRRRHRGRGSCRPRAGWRDPGAGRDRRARRPARRTVRADRHPRRRPGHLEHRRAPLAAGRRRAAPHPRSAHRPARRTRLAHRIGRRRGAAPTPTRPARPRSSAAAGRWPGWPGSACRPGWSTRPARSSPWPAGPTQSLTRE